MPWMRSVSAITISAFNVEIARLQRGVKFAVLDILVPTRAIFLRKLPPACLGPFYKSN
jgi:hypothetical protein